MAGTEAIRTDVAVIGAGPVGLFTAFQCGMAQLDVDVLDALPFLGGQCTALYPEKPIYDIPGFVEVTATELVDRLAAQAETFLPRYHLGDKASQLLPAGDGRWEILTESGRRFDAGAVIIASGAGSFTPRRPPIEGLSAYEGRSVFYAVNDVSAYAGRRVVIAGGGDSAVDWAIHLAEAGASIQLVHRRDKFSCAPASESRLRQLVNENRISLVTPFQVRDVKGFGGDLETVIVQGTDGEERRLKADRLLLCFGMVQSLGPLAEWGLEVKAGQIAVDPSTSETNLPGIFAVGDIAAYPGKRKLILCGFSEAALAVAAAYSRVFPEKRLSTEHSTTKGLPRRAAPIRAGGA